MLCNELNLFLAVSISILEIENEFSIDIPIFIILRMTLLMLFAINNHNGTKKIKVYKYVDGEPTLCPEVMNIINTYFNMYRTRDTHYYYYAPKSTPAIRVIRWLNDDFIGTMENPGI